MTTMNNDDDDDKDDNDDNDDNDDYDANDAAMLTMLRQDNFWFCDDLPALKYAIKAGEVMSLLDNCTPLMTMMPMTAILTMLIDSADEDDNGLQ